MKLFTTEENLDELAKALDESRKNSPFIKVPRQALANLLCDAGELFRMADRVKPKGDA